MNLKHLFELQAKLDDRIVKEKGLYGEDLLPKKILALQVELGELAQNWRGFKFWSNDQEPRTKVSDFALWVKNGREVDEEGKPTNCFKNPLLEEYVDCLHFILSIGLEIGESGNLTIGNVPDRETLTVIFNDVFRQVAVFQACMHDLKYYVDDKENFKAHRVHYSILLDLFLELGRMLGFTWEQVEQSYLQKNRINHERQNNGY